MPTTSEDLKPRSGANNSRPRTSQGGTGAARDGLRPYPDNGRCQLCDCLPKKERSLVYDRELEKQGNVTTENHRGWLCYHCKHLIDVVQTIGLKKVVSYLIPEPTFSTLTKRQESARKALLSHLSDLP